MAPSSAPPEFRHLFERYYQPITAYVRRRLPTDTARAGVDDAVADVFLVAWRRWNEVSAMADPLPWLYGVAGNVVRNHRRSATRNLRLVSKMAETTDEPRSTSGPPSAVDDDGELATALASLSDDDQEILRLVAWEGLDRHQAATALGCSPDAASQRLSRARRRLADALADRSLLT
jgi:RNA polymerase sigma-70 factor (ECF subfamily)